jgi:hypothetical protein
MMMKQLKKLLTTFAFALFVAAPVFTVVSPVPAMAADCDRSILGMPTWFRGLTDADCNITSPEKADGGINGFIWHIVLNIIEIGLFIAGYVALFFVLYGGFMFLTGGSNPGQTEKARITILNAVIGLAISMAAIAATNLIFRIING